MENSNNKNISPLELSKIDILVNGKKINLEEIGKLKVKRFYPTNTRMEFKEFIKNIDVEGLENTDDETKYAYILATTLKDLVENSDIGSRPNDDKMVNKIVYNNSNLGIQELNPSKKAKTSRAALIKLTKVAGLGSHIQIPLYHSGIWLTIRPLKDLEIVNLALDLSNELSKISRSTLGTMHTLFNLPFINSAIKYLRDAIVATTVTLEDDEDIFDYINVNDIYTILWGLAKSLYPKGHNIIVTCKNNSILDENTKLPKCTYKEHVHVDLEKLLWVDRSKLSEDQIAHMAKRRPKSVTKDEVKDYTESLPVNEEVNFVLTGNEGVNIEIALATPSVNKFLDLGDFIVTELQEHYNEIVRKSNVNFKDEEKIDAVREKILTTVYLKGYSHFVKYIKVEDAILEDVSGIAEALEIINDSEDLYKVFVDKLKGYIDRNLITTIGIPNYTCPSCGGKQGEDTIIPLAVYEYYFLLVSSRYDAIMERQATTN